ncbi:MAG: hypothetical protein OQK50_03835 [Deltaproteobacteria bacterium]|jgi:hypothetical protein|nr:hypothetical protein [Deltaproteobacteria bacterium]
MTFRPNKERFILLFAATTAALYIVFTQADELSGFLVNAAILVLPVGSTLFWLSRFEIRFEGSQIFYRSLFGGKVQFQESDIVSINPTDLRNLIHLVYTKQTLFIDLKNGDQIKINTKVFPAEVTEKMKQLTTRLQNNGGI